MTTRSPSFPTNSHMQIQMSSEGPEQPEVTLVGVLLVALLSG
jgi:hypothetical protein